MSRIPYQDNKGQFESAPICVPLDTNSVWPSVKISPLLIWYMAHPLAHNASYKFYLCPQTLLNICPNMLHIQSKVRHWGINPIEPWRITEWMWKRRQWMQSVGFLWTKKTNKTENGTDSVLNAHVVTTDLNGNRGVKKHVVKKRPFV